MSELAWLNLSKLKCKALFRINNIYNKIKDKYRCSLIDMGNNRNTIRIYLSNGKILSISCCVSMIDEYYYCETLFLASNGEVLSEPDNHATFDDIINYIEDTC